MSNEKEQILKTSDEQPQNFQSTIDDGLTENSQSQIDALRQAELHTYQELFINKQFELQGKQFFEIKESIQCALKEMQSNTLTNAA